MKELTVDAIIDNVEKVIQFVNTELEAICCSLKMQTQIAVIIDEIFSNISYYAYVDEIGKVTISIDVCGNPAAVVMRFMDSGIPYNPLKTEEPDITLSAEERQIGGLGIFMVKKMVDEISYKYKNEKNVLTITKKIALKS